INAWQASTRLDEFIQYAKEQGFNSVVVDFKDDQGLLRYSSALEIAQNVGSVRPLFDAEELIRRFHDADIYVIARMVVFKDKALYQYNNRDYAFWDSRLQRPWGVYRSYEVEPSADNPDPEPRIEQVEHWVDPYSAFVRNYNIQIARELEDIGVDEIQFDYIRFPSDGRPQDIVTRFLTNADNSPSRVDRNMERVRILAAFLAEARNSISIPIGTDVFGFNAWARMSYLGQDVEIISHYVDVISPMSYPSHYPGAFYEDLSYLDKAQFIYEEGTQRTREITDDRVVVRQYVQAFLIGGELRFEEDTYFSYLDRQLEGTIRGGGNGFTLWNNSGRYYMVNEATMSRRIKEAGTLTERK
ncbi:MAG: putative glycoside hydrolase, partial [Salinispira sp.]